MGGEVDVNRFKITRAAVDDRSQSGRRPARRHRIILPLIAAALFAAVGGLMFADEALAQRTIQIGAAKRTATISVYIGKTEDVRTDTSFVELAVGDPEVADVNPLTDRSLSILGKKNGTTRVSAYAEGKKLIGVFDVEVVYDSVGGTRAARSAGRAA
jgi:pilus assembly protein CpaC